MNVLRIKTTRFFANLFFIAGFAAVAPLLVTAFMPGLAATPALSLIPDVAKGVRIPWIPAGHAVPLLMAVAGVIVMIIASSIAYRQSRLLEWAQYCREEAARRVFAYRGEERIEPTLEPRSK